MRQAIRNRVAELVAVKARRENRKISKATIVAEAGLSKYTVDQYMANAVTRYDEVTLLKWCNYLGCNVGDLLIREEVPDTEKITHPVGPLDQVA